MFQDPRFWVAVSFLGFILLLYRPICRALLSGLDNRTARIRRELEEAARLRQEAEELLASYQHQQAEAKEEAKRIVQDAKQEALAMTQKAERDLDESLNRRIEMAIQKVSSYEAALLQDIRNHAIDLSAETVRRMVSQHLNPDMAQKMALQSIQNVDKKLN